MVSIHRHKHLVVADAIEAALLPVAGLPMPHLAKPGQGFNVDMDQIAEPLPLVSLHRRFGLQVSLMAEFEPVQSPGDGGEESPQRPGDVPAVTALVPEIYSQLQFLRTKPTLLGAASTPSIRQRDWTD